MAQKQKVEGNAWVATDTTNTAESAHPKATDTTNTAESLSNQYPANVGLGIDVVEIARMKEILARTPSFARRVFSQEEQDYCNSKPVPAAQYAMRFAAKEAVVKALGTGFSQGVGVRDIEVRKNARAKPYVVLTGGARAVADAANIEEIPISLSYTHTEAVACACAIAKDIQKATEAHKNPMEELALQFRQTRNMLDDIDAPSKQCKLGDADAPAKQ